MNGKRDLAQLLARVRATPGWSVELRKANHWCVRGPGGAVLFTGSTPRSRSLRNFLADLRRAGWRES